MAAIAVNLHRDSIAIVYRSLFECGFYDYLTHESGYSFSFILQKDIGIYLSGMGKLD